jgi:hypothetical protein
VSFWDAGAAKRACLGANAPASAPTALRAAGKPKFGGNNVIKRFGAAATPALPARGAEDLVAQQPKVAAGFTVPGS